jgi:outer membrane protein
MGIPVQHWSTILMTRYLFLAFVLIAPLIATAQNQKLAYVDSDYILSKLPEYTGLDQQLRTLVNEWNQELTAMQVEIDRLEQEFSAREILFTAEVRVQRETEIQTKKRAKAQYEQSRFGPEGEYFRQQTQLLEPIQRRVMEAIQVVAQRDGYDFVFDRSGDFLFLYTRSQWNISDEVLLELGINPTP